MTLSSSFTVEPGHFVILVPCKSCEMSIFPARNTSQKATETALPQGPATTTQKATESSLSTCPAQGSAHTTWKATAPPACPALP